MCVRSLASSAEYDSLDFFMGFVDDSISFIFCDECAAVIMGLFCKYLRVCCFRYVRFFLTLFPSRLLLAVCPHSILFVVFQFYSFTFVLQWSETGFFVWIIRSFDLYQYENVVFPWNYSRLNILFFCSCIKNTNKLNWRNCGMDARRNERNVFIYLQRHPWFDRFQRKSNDLFGTSLCARAFEFPLISLLLKASRCVYY